MNPQPGQLWKHSKKGTLYRILAIGKDSETLEEMVVYEAQYDNKESKVWIRALGSWKEMVEIGGEMVPRYVLMSEGK